MPCGGGSEESSVGQPWGGAVGTYSSFNPYVRNSEHLPLCDLSMGEMRPVLVFGGQA